MRPVGRSAATARCGQYLLKPVQEEGGGLSPEEPGAQTATWLIFAGPGEAEPLMGTPSDCKESLHAGSSEGAGLPFAFCPPGTQL